ncbi:precorrin-8X methylmutase [Lentisphaerota bacterium WC36G]|nr:precorrin-8X methylmutase [Lentisphaerae bacterium WC36]
MFEKISWNKTGLEIEKESFECIDKIADKTNFSPEQWHVVRRLIHTTADFSIADNVEFSNDPINNGLKALFQGATIITDSNMIKAGLSVVKLKNFNRKYEREAIKCFIADEDIVKIAQEKNITRALASVEKAKNILDGAIFLCGNAPLALVGVIKLVVEENIKPALIIGMPVGFVNVCESKELLKEIDVPYITIQGRRGGSPLAVAALHGIIENKQL